MVGRGFRSLYGSTKRASELFIEEYVENFGFPAIVNRCGVIAGAGQFGKTDQGVFTLWVARHLFGRGLQYTGFGGTGKQVRDVLHPADLFRLVALENDRLESLQVTCECEKGKFHEGFNYGWSWICGLCIGWALQGKLSVESHCRF